MGHHWHATLATEEEYVFAMVGTECQDLSAAGSLQGLQGIPITIDAAQLGARAHRLRNYWSNMACPISTQQVLTAVVRDPNRLVSDILDPGRAERPAACDTARGHYRCNVHGEPMRAWPTMMSFPDSYQFRGDGKGTVWDDATQTWGPPTPEEKERAMGFQTGATEAPNVTARQRGEMLGRAFDVRAVSRIMATCYLLNKTPTVPVQQCSMGSMAEYTLRSTANTTADPRDSDDTKAIPTSVLAQWAQSLHAAHNDAQMDAATLRQLYGK
ncbi:hypothetical protein CYMTET_16640 [Cymbomonas tetramitiformis]|uniref:Uncharacterized protein n=1 Tax=Cymbomonas tetramitiformis TaxID=36881 RepID=A0AAE0GBY2_9CHLO|nr:hypothetical protein CYMTET_16640 [Cymbomonas tetramitiformis]|eukprot:gene34547-biopygen33115